MTKSNKKNYSFIPQGDDSKDVWLKNFASKLPLYASKYNISADELNDMSQSSTFFTFWVNYRIQLDEFNRSVALYKNEMRDGIRENSTPSVPPTAPPSLVDAPPAPQPAIFVRAASLGSRIKRHHGYNPKDGADLGIETVSPAKFDPETVKPNLAVKIMEGGLPEIRWTKKSMDAIEIHVDRGDGFEFLAYDQHPHYTDVNTLAPGETAVYKYKAIFIKNDKRIGQWSNEVAVTVTGEL